MASEGKTEGEAQAAVALKDLTRRRQARRETEETTMKDDSRVLLPRKLTAENGAKALLSGEFVESGKEPCECLLAGLEPGDGACDGDCDEGYLTTDVPVGWSTIKNIYDMIVAHFSENAEGSDDERKKDKESVMHENQKAMLSGYLENAWLEGYLEALSLFASWKDGVQYVGTCGTTLKQATEDVRKKLGATADPSPLDACNDAAGVVIRARTGIGRVEGEWRPVERRGAGLYCKGVAGPGSLSLNVGMILRSDVIDEDLDLFDRAMDLLDPGNKGSALEGPP